VCVAIKEPQKQCHYIPPSETLCLGAEVDCGHETPGSRRMIGRFEVTVLGPETTEVPRDAQNKEEGPRLSVFCLNGLFAAKTKQLVTPEVKQCLKLSKNVIWASININTFYNGKIQKLFFILFFHPKTLL
jgi:hypothetical protein